VLVHAVARIAFDGLIPNIQASWVKLGLEGGARLLAAGCNDLGGTLMDENISRASGAAHGQLATPEELHAAITGAGRIPAPRTTTADSVPGGLASAASPGRSGASAVSSASSAASIASLRSASASSISSTRANLRRARPLSAPRWRSIASMICQSSQVT